MLREKQKVFQESPSEFTEFSFIHSVAPHTPARASPHMLEENEEIDVGVAVT